MTLFFDATMGVRVPRVLNLVKAPHLTCVALTDHYRDTPTHGLEIPDETWMRDAGSEGWLVLTQDRRIVERAHERAAIIANEVGVVILQPGNALNYDVLSFVIRRTTWLRRIDQETRPFVYMVHLRGRPRRIALDRLSAA